MNLEGPKYEKRVIPRELRLVFRIFSSSWEVRKVRKQERTFKRFGDLRRYKIEVHSPTSRKVLGRTLSGHLRNRWIRNRTAWRKKSQSLMELRWSENASIPRLIASESKSKSFLEKGNIFHSFKILLHSKVSSKKSKITSH